MTFWKVLLDIVVVLFLAVAMGGICARLKQSPIVGYILAGMFLGGPGSLGLISSEKSIETVSELGLALLLFSLGLEFSWIKLKDLGQRVLFAGSLQILLVIGVVAGLFFWLSGSGLESVLMGIAVYSSSTACVIRVLYERREIDSSHGRKAIAILLLQDIALVPLAIIVEVLSSRHNQSIWADIGSFVVGTFCFAAAIYVMVNVLALWLMRNLTRETTRELTVLLAVAIGLGSTWLAHTANISPALGAFIAGMSLAASPFAAQVRSDVSTIRIVLVTLFFGSVGMVANPGWIAENWRVVLLATLVLFLLKTAIVWLVLRLVGYSSRNSLAAGLSLAQVGEFGFVLANIASAGGKLSEYNRDLMISVTILGLLLTPLLVSNAPAIASFVTRRGRQTRSMAPAVEDVSVEASFRPSVVVIGFGPAGQLAVGGLANVYRDVLVVDLNSESETRALEMGFRFLVGDATNISLLQHANVQYAKVIVITLPNHSAAMQVLMLTREVAPKAKVIIRSRHQRDSEEFEQKGAAIVVGDEEEVGNQLSHHVSLSVLKEVATRI